MLDIVFLLLFLQLFKNDVRVDFVVVLLSFSILLWSDLISAAYANIFSSIFINIDGFVVVVVVVVVVLVVGFEEFYKIDKSLSCFE
jgi:hypothetical protein